MHCDGSCFAWQLPLMQTWPFWQSQSALHVAPCGAPHLPLEQTWPTAHWLSAVQAPHLPLTQTCPPVQSVLAVQLVGAGTQVLRLSHTMPAPQSLLLVHCQLGEHEPFVQ